MSKKLENCCPYCGEEGTEVYKYYITVMHKEDCLFYREEDDGYDTYEIFRWQSRPLEDALRKEVDSWNNTATVLSVKLKMAIGVLESVMDTINNPEGYDSGILYNYVGNFLMEIEGE